MNTEVVLSHEEPLEREAGPVFSADQQFLEQIENHTCQSQSVIGFGQEGKQENFVQSQRFKIFPLLQATFITSQYLCLGKQHP